MKTKVLLIAILISLFSCTLKDDETDIGVEPIVVDENATITGLVLDHVTSKPLENVIVKIEGLSNSASNTITDTEGKYEFEIKIQEATSISIIAEKDGYQSDTASANIAPGKTVNVTSLRLSQKSGDLPIISDKAASIYLFSQSTEKLGIKESGDIETALATFQVIDSTGIAINGSRAVEVEFRIVAGPGGGEFLYPTKLRTNDLGQATTSITTGTKAGVVQIMAEIIKENIVIRSKPIFFTIYGGFPVQERFAVACPKLNYSYWGVMNKEIEFTALIGDKYSNPVRPNTAVYFSTSEGVIGDFVYTDILGRATSTLATFGAPVHPVYGPGYFIVTAQTSTENAQIITTETLRLLSSNPIISNVSPTTFNIPNGGSETFTFTVMDFNGNPISSEHTISFTTQGGLAADPGIKVPDALFLGPGISEFTFSVGDANAEEIKPTKSSVQINVSGPFGTFSYTISGQSE
jgi:hypothetical protein